MDDDVADLIRQLCTRAGMIMEDASPIALGIRVRQPQDLFRALEELKKSAAQIVALIDAAKALTR